MKIHSSASFCHGKLNHLKQFCKLRKKLVQLFNGTLRGFYIRLALSAIIYLRCFLRWLIHFHITNTLPDTPYPYFLGMAYSSKQRLRSQKTQIITLLLFILLTPATLKKENKIKGN